MEDEIFSSGWCRVRPHHKLTDQSKSIPHDLYPFLPAETLFNAVTTKICSHLFRYDSEPLVNFMCGRNMATSIDTLPLEMLCHIFSFLRSDILLVCWNVSRPWRLVITQRSCWQKEGIWLQISNLEISHADTPSAENYLKKVLHVNSEKLRTIRITQVKADLQRFGVLAEHHFQDLSFPLFSMVDLSETSFHTVQVIGIVTRCRELVNLILRQVQVQVQFYFISFYRSTTLQKLKQYNFKFTFSVVIRYDQNKFIKLQF